MMTHIPILLFSLTIAAINSNPVCAQNILPAQGELENEQCIQCHATTESNVVEDWKNSIHAKSEPVVDCVACHGNEHENDMLNARRDSVCVECHGGSKDPVVHSYTSSKHGALMRIEGNQQDWTKPLSMANYRMPGCSYCHMHSGAHDVSAGVRQDLMDDSESEAVQDKVRAVCYDCHSPRYVTRLLENGESMLEIARKKFREANHLINQAAGVFTDEELAPVRRQSVKMKQHLINVYLGAGHQSPDYQWWHGQPALDGDLLKIKGTLSELYRASDGSKGGDVR